MSNDAQPIRLTRIGKVEVGADGRIVCTGFEGSGTSCRDVAILACAWAIGELQREMLADIEIPGGGNVAVD